MRALDDPLLPDFHKQNPSSGAVFTEHSHHDTYAAIDPRRVDLAGKTVFITGASRGIGRSLAVAYAQAGVAFLGLAARGSMDATVAAVEAAAAALGKPAPTLLPLAVDATDAASVDAAAKATAAALAGRPLDILVNNAGVLEDNHVVHESDPAEWWRTFDINLKGVYLASRAFLPLLLEGSGARTIVNLTSIGGLLVMKGMSAYNTSKLAVCRFTEYLAAEYADQQLVAFTIHPGGVATDMGLQLPEVLHSALTDTPALVADSIVYLTRAPQPWLSGRYVSVQWDLPELEARRDEVVAKDLLKNKLAV